MNKLLIKGATIINEGERSLRDIYIEGEFIKKIAEELEFASDVKIINAKGLIAIPGMIDELNNFVVVQKKPFFGICVGMQLLANNSLENGNHNGLGWISGTIKKLPSKQLKLPHMGWNSVNLVRGNFKIKPKETDYYFVHSYYFDCNNRENILAKTNYGISFPSIINKENIYGLQFHPEKSSDQGLDIIKSFIEL